MIAGVVSETVDRRSNQVGSDRRFEDASEEGYDVGRGVSLTPMSFILALAIVTSALHRSPFIIGQRLLLADLFLLAAFGLTFSEGLARSGYDRRMRGVLTGCWMLALGYTIGLNGSDEGFSAGAALAREVLPPLLFVGLASALARRPSLAVRGAQIFTIVSAIVAILLVVDPQLRSRATFQNPNYAANFCIIGMVLLSVSGWRLAIRMLIVVLLMFGVLQTASFGALAAIMAVVAYQTYTRFDYLASRERLIIRSVVVIVVLGVSSVLYPRLSTSEIEIGDALTTARFDRSGQGRQMIWSQTIDVWRSNPLGVGFDVTPDGEALYGNLGPREPHNDVLSALLNGGLIAVFGTLLILWSVWAMSKRGGLARTILVIMMVSGLFRQTWNFRHLWLALAIAVGLELSSAKSRRVAIAERKYQAPA